MIRNKIPFCVVFKNVLGKGILSKRAEFTVKCIQTFKGNSAGTIHKQTFSFAANKFVIFNTLKQAFYR